MKTLLSIISLLAALSSFGQTLLNEDWFITKEGAQAQDDMAWGVAADDSGNVYWATSQSINGWNVKDLFVYKVDVNGNEVWSNPFNYSALYEQQAYNAVLKDDILYVAGRTWTGYFSLLYSDALLFALDVNTQDTLWSFVWDQGYGYEEVDGLVIEDDAIYITGWTTDSVSQDCFIMKLDLNGNIVWNSIWGSPNYDQADGHCVVDDSTIYICGLYDLPNAQAHISAFNKSDGSFKWSELWGGSGVEDALGMGSDGTYLYQVGTTSSHADSAFFMVKWDKNGNKIWDFATNKAIKGRSMAFDDDGTLYVAATGTLHSAGGEDPIVFKVNKSNGNIEEYRTWGGVDDEVIHDISISGNYMYLTGRTWSYSANNFEDALLIKAPLFTPVGTEEIEESKVVEVYPQPASEIVNFSVLSGSEGEYTLSIIDSRGSIVESVTENDKLFRFSTQNIEAGMYFYQITLKGEVIATGKLVIQ